MSITQQVLPTSRPPIAKPQNQPNQPSIQSSFRNSHESETTKQTANSQLVAIGKVHQIWTVLTTFVKLLRFLFLISFVASFIPNNGVLLACTPCLRCLSFRYCSSLTVPEASRKFMCTRPSGIYSLSVLASDLVPIATETQHAINCKSSFQKFIGFFVFIHTLWYEVIMIYNLHM